MMGMTNLLGELVIVECRTITDKGGERWDEIFRARIRGVTDGYCIVQVRGVSLPPDHTWLGFIKPVSGMLTSVCLRDATTRMRLVRDE